MLLRSFLSLCSALLLLSCTPKQLQLPTDRADYGQGVSGLMAGCVGDYLLVAGGCNFPDQPVARGGKKRFYAHVYAARWNERPLRWQHVGELPRPLAYAVYGTHADRLYIVGGRTATQGREHDTSSTLALSYDGQRLTIDTLAPYPFAVSGAAGAVADGEIVVIGGSSNGRLTARVRHLDLRSPRSQWQKGESYPQVPLLKVTATPHRTDTAIHIYMVGTYGNYDDPSLFASYSITPQRYNLRTRQWQAIPWPDSHEDGHSFAGGMAWPLDAEHVVFTGGVKDGIFDLALNIDKLLTSLRHLSQLSPEMEAHHRAFKANYLHHRPEWYQFCPTLWSYNVRSRKWKPIGRSTDYARADAAIVPLPDGSTLLLGGETMPGIRSTRITKIARSSPLPTSLQGGGIESEFSE